MKLRHYDPRDVLERVGTCVHLQTIPLRLAKWFTRLTEQANSAYEANRRAERAENAQAKAENDAAYLQGTVDRMAG